MGSLSKKVTGLGKSLVRDKKAQEVQRKLKNKELAFRAPTGEAVPTLNSVTENKQLDEFLCTAQASNREFEEHEKENIKFVLPSYGPIFSNSLPKTEVGCLPIPRKPKWTKNMSAEEYHQLEYSNFMNWRGELANMQEHEGLTITPFEKNFELWRQLWHVVDKSDVVVQIVDGRNPLLYYSSDLDKYVSEVDPNKRNALLVNKADLLTETQRQIWAKYFDDNGIKFSFFSALLQLNGKEDGDGLMLNRQQLIDHLIKVYKHENEMLTIGFIGYPNVGKSSVVNALLGSKRASTSITPGKTKHFQTFVIDPEVGVCDCPGLVMPSVVSSKPDLILGGTLPIDQLQDHVPPVDLLVSRIPSHILEATYGFRLPAVKEGNQSRTSLRLLQTYALTRGYTTQRGLPDEARASRYILKDYINGKLLYCHGPPGVDQDEYQIFPPPPETNNENGIPLPDDLDSFFHQLALSKHHVRSNKTQQNPLEEDKSTGKPWKKHYNRNKRTKAAKKFAHLDQ